MAWEAKLGARFAVFRDGVDLGLPPTRTVGVLLVGMLRNPQVWMSRAQLASLIYREKDTETARIALRQTIRRFRLWLGEEAIESQQDCVRLGPSWTCNLNLDSGEPASAAMIAPALDHDWLDEIRRHWRPTTPIGESAVDAFDKAVRVTAEYDRNEARSILVGGQSLLWPMSSDNVADLLAVVRPRKWTEPAVYGYLEVKGIFESKTGVMATATESFQHAYRNARVSGQRLDAERIASWALYSLLESGDVSAASEWRSRLGNRPDHTVLVANAVAADAWNQNRHDTALSIMRSASRDAGGAGRAQRVHFWSNYAVLAAESGDVAESIDAEARCQEEHLGILDIRWRENLTYAHGLRLIRQRDTEEATRTLTQYSANARSQGWRMSALYAEEFIALARATAGDGPGAQNSWNRANALRSGTAVLNPRRRAIYQRVRAA